MERIVQNLIQTEFHEMLAQNVNFDHAIINIPYRSGDWPYILDDLEMREVVTALFTVCLKQMNVNGHITIGYSNAAKQAIDLWLENNPGRLQVIDKFRCWTGLKQYEQKVSVVKRVENYRWITLARVGETPTRLNWKFGDVFPTEHRYNAEHVTKDGKKMWPVDGNNSDEGLASPEEWWKNEIGIPVDTYCPWFKYHLVEYGDDVGNYTTIPFNMNWDGASSDGSDLTWQQREILKNAVDNAADLPAIRHVMSGTAHRTKLTWFYYWWLKRYTQPGQDVFIPFTGDGDAILASLLTGRGFYGVEAQVDRWKICKDLVLEYRNRFHTTS